VELPGKQQKLKNTLRPRETILQGIELMRSAGTRIWTITRKFIKTFLFFTLLGMETAASVPTSRSGRNQAMSGNGKWNGKLRLGVPAAILLLAGFTAVAQAGWFDGIFKKSPAEIAKSAGVVETADAVMIPLKALDSGKALFLEADMGGRPLYYFALKSSDSTYRAAFDACDVCFRTNRGYRQEGDRMVCNKCGQTFPSVRIGEIKGGCNPHPLARKVEGQYLVIQKGDMATGKDYFAGNRS
jgi:uncharacterized membrane protein